MTSATMEPPARLYKFLPRARVDVVENLRIRFTPLLSTNDIFEVRRTFKKFAGPRFEVLLQAQAYEVNAEQIATEELTRLGFSVDQARGLARSTLIAKFGSDFENVLRGVAVGLARNFVVPNLNADQTIEKLLRDVAGKLVALSLTEDKYNSTMWTHYGEQGQGFLLEFDTAHEFFRLSPKSGNSIALRKIEYFDDQFEELLDDVGKAFVSKTSNWAYEKEWRLTVRPDEADVEIAAEPDPIHLFSLPQACITGVLLGYNADAVFSSQLKNLVRERLPHVEIKKITVDRIAGRFAEALA